ncbi:proteasomal ubiquitin receptor ADRM1-like [Paramacrobiotus metropolitanus]|uniref:proteasomal ubiquitin receptor ADRM1-like n=1 Tax=Paramacrobiotus metropolitanus TaxID=2943436 RepID=UPI00244602C5|nr:proteasomal ubiquitin receptor ADRM1-like [Paramacrobiotus metropolitanus]
MALFGRPAQQRGSNRYLVEFKAGRMKLEGTTVHADPRKGLVYITKGDDELLHLYWKERNGTTPEDDVIIFPNEVEFKKIPQCTTGRVFLLKFKGSSRKLFYWMQEPDASKDEELFKKVSDYLAGKTPPRTPGTEGGNIAPDLQSLGIDESSLQDLLQGVDRNQLLQMLGLGGAGGGAGAGLLQGLRGPASNGSAASPSSPTPAAVSAGATPAASRPAAPTGAPAKPAAQRAAGARGSAAGKIQLADLRNILGSVQPTAEQPPVDWTPALTRTVLQPLLSNKDFVDRLVPHLPQDPLIPHTPQEVMSTIQSPQFQQAIQAFTSAFETRQLGPLIQEFNLGAEAVQAANNGDFAAFVAAMQRNGAQTGQDSSTPGSGGGSGSAPGKDDDEMSVD